MTGFVSKRGARACWGHQTGVGSEARQFRPAPNGKGVYCSRKSNQSKRLGFPAAKNSETVGPTFSIIFISYWNRETAWKGTKVKHFVHVRRLDAFHTFTITD